MLLLPFTSVATALLTTVAPLLAARFLAPCGLHEAQYVLLKVTLTRKHVNMVRELCRLVFASMAAAMHS